MNIHVRRWLFVMAAVVGAVALLAGALLAALAAGLVAPASAQTLLYTLDTPNPQRDARFGISLGVGDVDGDGKPDIVVGAEGETVGDNAWQGQAYVFSGANGSLLFTLDTPNPQASAGFGNSLAVGEVNGDGKADIAVSAANEGVNGNQFQGRAYVFSGADGSLLLTLDSPNPQAYGFFGRSVAVGDVDGDGKGDIAVGATWEVGYKGRAYVFSGADGSLLLTLDSRSPYAGAEFGWSVAVGEVNGDGKADIAVGAWLERVGDNQYQGRAYVFSGADGSLLLTLDSPSLQAYGQFGFSVALGDVNGDGRADIAVGARLEDVDGNTNQGRAYVFSGADGSLLFTLESPNPQADADFGWSVTVADVNGDDKGDTAVGAALEDVGGNWDQGRVYAFSGADGSLLFTLDKPNPQPTHAPWFGDSLAAGDVNADGEGDIAVGAALDDVGGNVEQGQAHVFLSPSTAVGGVAELPHVSDSSRASYAVVAALAAAALVALTAGGWYARRRSSRG